MNALSSLREKVSQSKKYRDSFAAAVVKRMIPLQIRVLRKQRDWSQSRLATESNLTQGVISRAEDPDYGNLTVNTLVRIGLGFDCAFVGRFVPFSELAGWYMNLKDEKSLEVPSFEDDLAFKELRDEPEKIAAARAYTGAPHDLTELPAFDAAYKLEARSFSYGLKSRSQTTLLALGANLKAKAEVTDISLYRQIRESENMELKDAYGQRRPA